jgi:hypothetical protein
MKDSISKIKKITEKKISEKRFTASLRWKKGNEKKEKKGRKEPREGHGPRGP